MAFTSAEIFSMCIILKYEFYIQAASCFLGMFVNPILLYKLFYFKPLDRGLVLNEEAMILNSLFPSRNWNGCIIKEGEVIKVQTSNTLPTRMKKALLKSIK